SLGASYAQYDFTVPSSSTTTWLWCQVISGNCSSITCLDLRPMFGISLSATWNRRSTRNLVTRGRLQCRPALLSRAPRRAVPLRRNLGWPAVVYDSVVTRRREPHVSMESSDVPVPSPAEAKERLEQALFEIRRVIAGQDDMLERVLVCLLAQGHLLIEGVPGLAKTLTIKTTAGVLGGSFSRVQFTPDLVPSDLVGTRIYRPGEGAFDTELGPVFCNFLLADEINRAPAKVQSALLEVMQERQVTIGHTTYPVPEPFLVMATQNPIESEGTYPLPEAQVDRFMLKVLIGYPEHDEELTIVQRQLVPHPELRQALSLEDLRKLQSAVFSVYVDPALVSYSVAVATATRDPAAHGLAHLREYIAFG